ncbi:MAG: hypothetical protein R3C09_15215 [Pirellulaceae bacterium]
MFQPKTSFRLLSAAALLIGFSSVTCFAQDHAFRDDAASVTESKRLPLSGSSAAAYQRYDTYREEAQQQIRQRVQFEARQRVLREEWNQWIGYSPARPTVNASNLSNGLPYYYVPSRGQIVTTGMGRSWYW